MVVVSPTSRIMIVLKVTIVLPYNAGDTTTCTLKFWRFKFLTTFMKPFGGYKNPT